MFEVSGNELQQLDDRELRTLVARLAIAELSAKGLPVSGVTAGGDQNAADGGLDVRVELQEDNYAGDFIPRVPLGIQVKKPDMGPASIAEEMKPKGTLRAVLGELADSDGAYVIVSSQGSVADKPLQKRREAMSGAYVGHRAAHKVHTDFYDRERLASWVNQYPGVAAWVRARIGRPLAGWQSVGDWSGIRVGGDGKYIADDAACLVDARSKNQAVLPIIEGINTIRGALTQPGQCVRLIGMSGLGKTRLVQALFEGEVGTDALDPSLAVYTDYSETPDPTATHLALHLIETGQRAILVIDNCNPKTHSDLAKICGGSKSRISLITVEYDVRDDEPERTEVFRLQAASEGTIGEWLKSNFNHISQVDRDRIVEFSGGNFRIAGVLADTLRKGDTLGHLKDRELFARIFQQRNDRDDDLLSAAEALSLVYSFDGTDTSTTGELAMLAPIAGVNTPKLYGFVAELKRRSVVQSRGRWRALLPHAIANRLAAQALERIPANDLDTLCATVSVRMQKSLTRRLGYLHDSEEAKQAVARWLRVDGPLGNLFTGDDDAFQLLRNIAPVAPEEVLRRAEDETGGPNGGVILNPKLSSRWQLTMVLKSLAYEQGLFDRAAKLLVKFVAAEAPDESRNSARGPFEELFHLHLSGTQSPPDQRRRLIRDLYASSDPNLIRCGHVALRALLQSGHFSSSSNFDFGARPRDFGWHPPTSGDIWNWYSDGINLAVELASNCDLRSEIRRIVSGSLRDIVGIEACLTAVEAAATEFLTDGEWIDGWLAVRGAIGFDGKSWRPEVLERVRALEAQLRPSDPLNVARAYVMKGRGSGFDFIDGDKDDSSERDYAAVYRRLEQKAEAIGKDFGDQSELLLPFLEEALQSNHASRAFSFGVGLAQSSTPLTDTWQTLCAAFRAIPITVRNATILGGFLRKLNEVDASLCSELLDEMLADPEMAPHFVYLQAQTEINEEAVARLRKAIASGRIASCTFGYLACGVVGPAPQDALGAMLTELSRLEGGATVALDIFHMATFCRRTDGLEVENVLLDAGHQLLLRTDYKNVQDVRDHQVHQAIKECYAGPGGEERARELCRLIKAKIKNREVYAFQLDHAFDALFEVQPTVALDEFLQDRTLGGDGPIYGRGGLSKRSPLEKVDPAILWSWADQAPDVRYPLLSRSLNVFATQNYDDDDGLSPLFLEGLEKAPDKAAFLNSNKARMLPNGWCGNLSIILDRRREYLGSLADHPDSGVRSWVAEQASNLKQRADHERGREAESEETFE